MWLLPSCFLSCVRPFVRCLVGFAIRTNVTGCSRNTVPIGYMVRSPIRAAAAFWSEESTKGLELCGLIAVATSQANAIAM